MCVTEQTIAHRRTQAEKAGFKIDHVVADGRRVAPKALDKFKTRIRDMIRRTRGFACSGAAA
jgi:hypothetical protein